MMAAEDRGPLMHARIGMLRALNRHVERAFDPSRKDTQWRRIWHVRGMSGYGVPGNLGTAGCPVWPKCCATPPSSASRPQQGINAPPPGPGKFDGLLRR
jgi:hypothetical protein